MASFSSEPSEISFETLSEVLLLKKVHWSWLLPPLKLYQEPEQKLLISALSPYAAKNLSKNLTLSSSSVDLSEIGRSFLKEELMKALLQHRAPILPLACLPASPLNALLELDKKQLTALIDRLSLYDLALELKQLVETKTLKKLYALLNSQEKKILQEISGQKDLYFLGKIGLDRWDGTEEALRTLLHKKGLSRLGAGISHQDPDLIWYVCHLLDIGRGTHLEKQCIKKTIAPEVSEGIIQQIESQLL